jgi:hypothetical protein
MSLEYRTMEKVQKPSNSECYTPSSEPFRIYWLDIIFSNFAVLSTDHPEYGLVQPDHFHPPFITDSAMSVRHYKKF